MSNKLKGIEKVMDDILNEEYEKRSQELFDKSYCQLAINESTQVFKYIYDLQHPIWKDVIIKGEKTNYQVNNIGQVRNIKTNKFIALQTKYDTGYIHVALSINGKSTQKLVHTLVAEAFIPNPENKPQVNHKNGKKGCNWVGNLEWNTAKENAEHAIKIGLHHVKRGMEHGNNKYTDKQIHEICKLLEKNMHPKEISEILHIPKNVVESIKYYNCWSEISKNYNIPKSGDIPVGPRRKVTKSNKYSPDIIEKTCQMIKEGKTSLEISNALGVNIYLPSDIKSGRIWRQYALKYDIDISPSSKRHRESSKPFYNEAKLLIADGVKNGNVPSNNVIIKKLNIEDTQSNRKTLNRIRSRLSYLSSTTIGQL